MSRMRADVARIPAGWVAQQIRKFAREAFSAYETAISVEAERIREPRERAASAILRARDYVDADIYGYLRTSARAGRTAIPALSVTDVLRFNQPRHALTWAVASSLYVCGVRTPL